jgi:transcription termination/antitermination protein NusG
MNESPPKPSDDLEPSTEGELVDESVEPSAVDDVDEAAVDDVASEARTEAIEELEPTDETEPTTIGDTVEQPEETAERVEAEREVLEDAVEIPSSEPTSEPEEQAAELVEIPEPEAVAEAPEASVEAAVEPEPMPAAEAEPEAEPETVVSDPFRGPGEWYVVHTYAGYENKVKTNLESRIHTMQMEDKIFDVHIPMEDVMEIKGGKRQVVQRKVFPGYLLVKMVYDNDSWYVVRNTPGVTGFVAAGTGSKPTPLSKREVEKILAVKKEAVKPQFRLGFEENDVVRIISGPFADFNGTISEINLDQSKLKVLVNIFDRETPVELSFDQVAKV